MHLVHRSPTCFGALSQKVDGVVQRQPGWHTARCLQCSTMHVLFPCKPLFKSPLSNVQSVTSLVRGNRVIS